MTWTLYWLSLIDNAHDTLNSLSVLASVGLCLVSVVAILGSPNTPSDTAADVRIKQAARRWLAPAFVTFMLAVALATLVPTKRDVVEAYFMVEGAKVANGASATRAFERLDKLLDELEQKWIKDK